ncbi:MAG: methyl-accepting chemotaxis protein, partial [Desulfobulbaceae bacterium]|nr:methyl-accepting chemotaxis protein [Desulfobulbaceae bacterium]HIJ90988.1 methyl-accepting chemotaxis protein [Deltaproteobacteria bacterium]
MKDLFNNMKMFKKLLTAFLLVAAVCGVVGGVGYYGISQVDDALVETAEVRLPSIQGLGLMKEALNAIKSAERTMMIESVNDADRAHELKNLEKRWAVFNKGFAIYEPLPQTAEESVLWQQFLKDLDGYKAEHRKVVEILGKVQAWDVHTLGVARGIGFGSERVAFSAVMKGLDAISELNFKVAEEAKIAGKADAARSKMTAMVAVGAGVLIAVLFGVFLANSLSGPIQAAAGMLSELGKGHLGQRLRMQRKDEVGEMARAMDDFADNLQNNFVVALEKIADGNFAFDAVQVDDKDAIGAAMKKTLTDMNATLSQIYLAGEQVNSAAAQVSSASQSLSQGATESASSIEEITSSMTEMGSQTKLNAGNATQANQLAGQAR